MQAMISEVCNLLCSRSLDHKVVIGGNELTDHFKCAADVIEIDIAPNDVISYCKRATTWTDACVSGLLTIMISKLEAVDADDAMIRRGWSKVHTSFRSPFQSQQHVRSDRFFKSACRRCNHDIHEINRVPLRPHTSDKNLAGWT